MDRLEKLLYTAKTHTTGGRESGVSRSSDGRLDVKLSTPDASGTGTNPEQLLAAGWSACFVSVYQSHAEQHQRCETGSVTVAEYLLTPWDVAG